MTLSACVHIRPSYSIFTWQSWFFWALKAGNGGNFLKLEMCLNITCKQACSTNNKRYPSSGSSHPVLGVTISLVETCIECQSFLAKRDLSSQVSSSRSSNDWYLGLVFLYQDFWAFGFLDPWFGLPSNSGSLACLDSGPFLFWHLTSICFHTTLWLPQTPKSKLSGCFRAFCMMIWDINPTILFLVWLPITSVEQSSKI